VLAGQTAFSHPPVMAGLGGCPHLCPWCGCPA